MCKIGDILLIYNAKDRQPVGVHPFIVLDDTAGKVRGVYGYDFIGLLISSADTPEKKEKLKKFEGNFPLVSGDKIIHDSNYNNKDAYVKADQFFYFDKNKINYIKIGSLEVDIFNLIIEFIEELSARKVAFRQIVTNAKKD